MDRSLRRTGERQIQAGITFFYYRDLPAAQKFYEDVLGLRMMVDQGFCKIYQVSPTSFVGLVDEKQGSHSASETKSVTLSFVTKEIDEWYEYLVSKGTKLRGPISDSSRHPTRGFVAYDPEGYCLEFEKFLDNPQNRTLMGVLERQNRRSYF
jgi:predicted enzyme related to lactoylglutathione lyase